MEPSTGPAPREAIDYLRRKKVRQGYDYREVWREEHWQSFTVANAMANDLLSDIQGSIAEAMEQGTTYEQWRKTMAADLRKRGWWGRRKPPDPDDPDAVEEANLYMSRRLETIWRTNVGQAYMAGIWERGIRSNSHPYVLYRLGPSREHRDQHRAWDGVLLPKTDPFWAIAFPRNGWGCKCTARFVSEAQHRRYTTRGLPGGKKPVTRPPTLEVDEYYNEQTGRTHVGYRGIDHGFERNPGLGREQQLGRKFIQSSRQLAQSVEVRPTPARAGADAKPESAVRPVSDVLDTTLYKQADAKVLARLERTMQKIDQVHSTSGLPDMMLVPFTPQESDGISVAGKLIGVRPRSDHPELTLAHEIGHQIYEVIRPQAAAELIAAIADTRVMRLVGDLQAGLDGADEDDFRLLFSEKENFARAYSQYVAWRTGDVALVDEINAVLRDESPFVLLMQWRYADFFPLVLEFDKLFERMGWLTR